MGAGAYRTERHTGTTDANGLYTGTFNKPFKLAPAVVPELVNPTVTQGVRITSVSATGFTAHAFQMDADEILGIPVSSPNATNLEGVLVEIVAVGK